MANRTVINAKGLERSVLVDLGASRFMRSFDACQATYIPPGGTLFWEGGIYWGFNIGFPFFRVQE